MTRTYLTILRALRGDQDAFTELHREHFEAVLRTTALALGVRPGAYDAAVEDAVQAAFVDVFALIQAGNLTNVRSRGAFRWYVTRAAKNKAIDHRRRESAEVRGGGRVQRLEGLDDGGDAWSDIAEPSWDASEGFAQASFYEQERYIEEALRALPHAYRDVLALTRRGLSARSIALSGSLRGPSGDTVRSEDQVRVLRCRARAYLRQALELGEKRRRAAAQAVATAREVAVRGLRG